MKRGVVTLPTIMAMGAVIASLLCSADTAGTASADEQPFIAYLSDLRWESANTGWVALADDNLPKLDTSFMNTPISIGGSSYDKGLGTFPLSEISYKLDGTYNRFQATAGVDDVVPSDRGSVVFKVFLDGVPVLDSGVVQAGAPAVDVDVPLGGATELKLMVEDAGDGSSLDYADWAEARLSTGGEPDLALGETLKSKAGERSRQLTLDWARVQLRSEQELRSVSKAFRGTLPSTDTRAVFDPEQRIIVLANNRLAITLGYGGERHGLLNVTNLDTGTLAAIDTSPSISGPGLAAATLSSLTVPATDGGFFFRRVEDPALGTGTDVTANYFVPDRGLVISPHITLFDASSYLTYQIEIMVAEEGTTVDRFSFFGQDKGTFVVGEEPSYVTDYSLIRRADVRDDSAVRKELVGLGKPILVFDRARSQSLLMTILDQVSQPADFAIRRESGGVRAQVAFGYSEQTAPDRPYQPQFSRRLMLTSTGRGGFREAAASYRQVMAALHPQPPIPDWVKYQWGTWYAFGMNYDEEIVRNQIDYIAENLADLGPWSILLDAGWYVAEGRPGSSWENVDTAKFPSGLRALVDYAHWKGIKVVLYFSAPYLDDREVEGNWLGLKGFIEEHPDWVIRLQSDNQGASYVYDFKNPDLVEYMRNLIASFFSVYDVDGIKIDGLGQAEGEQLSIEERDTFGDVNKIRMFTMDVYRLVYDEATKAKKDVYVESGWAIPAYANQYAHTFRYADEFPALEHRYPQPGLLEHIDYATLQKRVLGQRPNMGMVWGGPESQEMVRLWFQAALAMGTQMTISTDLTRLSGRDLSALRSVLAHYNAFEGETYFVGAPQASSFATSADGITYLGAVNREADSAQMSFRLSEYGLSDSMEYLLYDVSSGAYSKVKGSFQTTLPGPGFRLFLLRSTPGVVWTNGLAQVQTTADSTRLTVEGPNSIIGSIQLYAPRLRSVWLDGKQLPRSVILRPGENYSYDASTGVLRLRYRHDFPHVIEIRY